MASCLLSEINVDRDGRRNAYCYLRIFFLSFSLDVIQCYSFHCAEPLHQQSQKHHREMEKRVFERCSTPFWLWKHKIANLRGKTAVTKMPLLNSVRYSKNCTQPRAADVFLLGFKICIVLFLKCSFQSDRQLQFTHSNPKPIFLFI